MLTVGEKIPEFIGELDNGEQFDSSKLTSKYTIFYFYPKDLTPGCTAQACGLKDINSELQTLGAHVYGIGKGNKNSHKKFKNTFNLNFPLIIDESLEISNLFGVTKTKSMFGKSFLSINRTTFIADQNGMIVDVMENVNPLTHAEELIVKIKQFVN